MQHLHPHVTSVFLQNSSWDDAVVATISDASFCQDQEQLDGITKNFKSQKACISALALGNALNAAKMLFHPVEFDENQKSLSQYIDGRSLRTEHGLRTRPFIVDMRGRLNFRQREETASAAMGHVWLTDCESLFAHLISHNTEHVGNKRLAIDLSALKELIWDNRDDCDEEVDGSKGDYLRWIDTSSMLSDCLSKTMTSCRLNETLSTGIFDVREPRQQC